MINRIGIRSILACGMLICVNIFVRAREDTHASVDTKDRRSGPDVGLLYFPYEESMVREIAAPQPDYRSWTDRRMTADLRRISRLGVDLLQVSISPSIASDPIKAESYIAFFEKLDDMNAGPDVVLRFDATGMSKETLQELLKDCGGMGIFQTKNYRRDRNKPILLAINGEHLMPVPHPIFSVQAISFSPFSITSGFIHRIREAQLSNDSRHLLLFAGIYREGPAKETRSWKLKRRDGKELNSQLKLALTMDLESVTICSWNDFATGSFIEPNTLDASQASDALAEALEGRRNLE